MDRLHIYEERIGKYIGCFKQYVNNAKLVVDVGCGAGAFSKALAHSERLVIALDLEEKALRRIKSLYVERICADAHNLPFRSNSVDCVLSLTYRAP